MIISILIILANRNMSMETIKEFKGLWFLPNASDNQIPGTLIVERDLITLETIGVLGSDSPIDHIAGESVPQYDVIWGISSEAKEISVFNCYESISLNTDCPFSVAKYSVQVVAVGKYIKSLKEAGNYDVKAYIEELSYWFRPDIIKFSQKDKIFSFVADLENANQIEVKLDDGCILGLEGEVNISYGKIGMQVKMNQMSTLNFACSKPISMNDAKRYVFLFEQFLSFATLSTVQRDRFLLIDKDGNHTKTKTIEIYDKKGERLENPERFWEFLFVYETIKESFSSIICKWYAEKDMSPIRAHLIDSVGHRGTFCSNDFLIVAQAVEGFYCRFRKDGQNLTTILYNLRKEFSDISILELSDYDIDCIRDTRHYLSHLLPPGKKEHVVEGHNLYNLNHKLRKLLLCCMLNFVGFNNQAINGVFSKSHNSYLRMVSGESRVINDEAPQKLDVEVLSTTKISEAIPE